MFIKLIVIFLIVTTSWAYLFPEQALAILAEFKRQLRLRIIHRAGAEALKELGRNLHRFAMEEGIETDMVEEVLAENQGLVIDRLGRKYADQILGEPDPKERYY